MEDKSSDPVLESISGNYSEDGMNALHAWYEQVLKHIQSTKLHNLSEYEVNGKRIFNSFTDLTRSKKVLKEFSYSDFKHADDILYLSQDLIYAIAIIEILHPKINNVINEGGTYEQTLEDHLYLRYVNYALQTLYSIWDRLGDCLDLFFDTKQKDDVYLSKVLDRFPQAYRSQSYHSLVKLYKDKVLLMIEERHSTVHSFTLKAKHWWGAIEHAQNDISKLEALQSEKESYPTRFRDQHQFMFDGFELVLKLISELPNKEKE